MAVIPALVDPFGEVAFSESINQLRQWTIFLGNTRSALADLPCLFSPKILPWRYLVAAVIISTLQLKDQYVPLPSWVYVLTALDSTPSGGTNRCRK